MGLYWGKLENKMETTILGYIGFRAKDHYELLSKVLKGGYIGDCIRDYCRGHQGGYLEFRL